MMIFGIISGLLVLGLTGILFWSNYRMYQATQLPEDTEFNEHYSPAPSEYPGEMIDVESCTPIYAVGWWAHPGLRTFYFTGEYNDKREPLVWYFNDHNGFYESFTKEIIEDIDKNATFEYYRIYDHFDINTKEIDIKKELNLVEWILINMLMLPNL